MQRHLLQFKHMRVNHLFGRNLCKKNSYIGKYGKCGMATCWVVKARFLARWGVGIAIAYTAIIFFKLLEIYSLIKQRHRKPCVGILTLSGLHEWEDIPNDVLQSSLCWLSSFNDLVAFIATCNIGTPGVLHSPHTNSNLPYAPYFFLSSSNPVYVYMFLILNVTLVTATYVHVRLPI